MKRLLLAAMVIMVAILPLRAAFATPDEDLHCPGKPGAPPATILYEGTDGGTILTAGTTFCVKASTGNSGVITADGVKTVQDYVTWLNSGGQTPGVSYFVVYTEPEEPEVCPEGTDHEGESVTPCDDPSSPPPPPPPTTAPPTTPPPTTVPPTTPPPTTSPPTTPPPVWGDRDSKCERHGADRPRCNPTVAPPGGLAFTGQGDMTPMLGLLALALAIVGTMLLRLGRKRA